MSRAHPHPTTTTNHHLLAPGARHRAGKAGRGVPASCGMGAVGASPHPPASTHPLTHPKKKRQKEPNLPPAPSPIPRVAPCASRGAAARDGVRFRCPPRGSPSSSVPCGADPSRPRAGFGPESCTRAAGAATERNRWGGRSANRGETRQRGSRLPLSRGWGVGGFGTAGFAADPGRVAVGHGWWRLFPSHGALRGQRFVRAAGDHRERWEGEGGRPCAGKLPSLVLLSWALDSEFPSPMLCLPADHPIRGWRDTAEPWQGRTALQVLQAQSGESRSSEPCWVLR